MRYWQLAMCRDRGTGYPRGIDTSKSGEWSLMLFTTFTCPQHFRCDLYRILALITRDSQQRETHSFIFADVFWFDLRLLPPVTVASGFCFVIDLWIMQGHSFVSIVGCDHRLQLEVFIDDLNPLYEDRKSDGPFVSFRACHTRDTFQSLQAVFIRLCSCA